MEAADARLGLGREATDAVAAERVAALVKRFFLAATAVLFVAGALGLVLRQSQAARRPGGAQ